MKKDDGFYLRTSPIDRANFKAAAALVRLPVSEIIRTAVREFLENHKPAEVGRQGSTEPRYVPDEITA